MYLIGHQHPESVTNISNLSRTHLVSNIRQQHRRRLNLHVGDKICLGQIQNFGPKSSPKSTPKSSHPHTYVTNSLERRIKIWSPISTFLMEQKKLMQQRFFDDHNNLTFENFESR